MVFQFSKFFTVIGVFNEYYSLNYSCNLLILRIYVSQKVSYLMHIYNQLISCRLMMSYDVIILGHYHTRPVDEVESRGVFGADRLFVCKGDFVHSNMVCVSRKSVFVTLIWYCFHVIPISKLIPAMGVFLHDISYLT